MSDQELLEYIRLCGIVDTETERKEIIKKINKIKPAQFKYLLRYGSKAEWSLEAEIIVALGYPCVKPILNKLFEWLKDMNWPGASYIQMNILLKLDKPILVSSLDIVLRQALIEGDWQWIYWLSELAEEAHLTRNDFSQTDNAYDIVLFYNYIFEDDVFSFDKYCELPFLWEYPRIKQFIICILVSIKTEKPNSEFWNKSLEILNLIPSDVRDSEIKKALRQLYDAGRIKEIGYLKEIIPIGESSEDFLNYIFS